MVYYTSLPLIMHNDALHSAASQNGRCGPSSSPPSNNSSPRLQLNISPSPIMNLSNNSSALQTIDPPSPQSPMQYHQQSLPQNYSNDQINQKLLQNGDLSYINMEQHPKMMVMQNLGSNAIIKNSDKFKCEQCSMSFGSKSAHTSHMKSHAKQYQTAPQNSRTMNPANGSDQYQCDVCKKTFAVPARLVSFSYCIAKMFLLCLSCSKNKFKRIFHALFVALRIISFFPRKYFTTKKNKI